jgi:phytoene dehydrogenase-like protein
LSGKGFPVIKLVDVAVVGGGVAGLIAAHDTSRMGLATVLFEAAPTLGGRAKTRAEEGFHFNQGPHALYVDGEFNKALSSMGVDVPGHRLQLKNAIALWEGRRHPLPLRLETMQHVTPLDDLDRSQLIRTFGEVMEGACDYAGQPLTAFTGRLRPRVATVIESLIRLVTYVHAPDLIDGKAALDQFRLAFGGVLYIDGGWGELVAGLAESATTAGADLRTRSTVASVVRQEAGWMLAGPGLEDHLASCVVLAVAPQPAATIVGQSRDLTAVIHKTQPIRLTCLDLGLSTLPSSEATFALGMDQPTYFSVHSTTARLAPNAGAMVHVARYLAPAESQSPAHFAALEELTDVLQPGWREVEVRRQRLSAIVVAHDFPGFEARGQRGPITVQDAPGLFLAGDWIGAQGMLSDASAASARAAARAVGAYREQIGNAVGRLRVTRRGD